MTKKIMHVEDDKSLREIYGVRLLAEGYDIVSAGDGEEALAMAIKERPHLIISDVMMPKISGFDLLDILRSTTETKNIRVIMMTALSSEDQRMRGESLGADRYLVKSQVGIEDVVHVVHEVMEDAPAQQPATPITSQAPVAPQQPAPVTQPAPAPQQDRPNLGSLRPAAPAPASGIPVTPAPVQPQPMAQPQGSPQNVPQGSAPLPVPTQPPKPIAAPHPPQARSRIIQPLNDPNVPQVNLNELLDKEIAKEAGMADNFRPVVATTEQEKALVNAQLGQFQPTPPAPTFTPAEAIPTISVDPSGNITPQQNPNPAQPVPTQQPIADIRPTPVQDQSQSLPIASPSPTPAQPSVPPQVPPSPGI